MARRTKQTHLVKKFFLLVSILALYTSYLVFQFGSQGILLGGLTWSAFVLATPIADAGFMLDLPLRSIFGLRMVISEIVVWMLAISLNTLTYFTHAEVYADTRITTAFYQVLSHPWPNWIIIFLSGIGTFGSLWIADTVYTQVKDGRLAKLFNHTGWQLAASGIGLLALYVLYRWFLSLFGIEL